MVCERPLYAIHAETDIVPVLGNGYNNLLLNQNFYTIIAAYVVQTFVNDLTTEFMSLLGLCF